MPDVPSVAMKATANGNPAKLAIVLDNAVIKCCTHAAGVLITLHVIANPQIIATTLLYRDNNVVVRNAFTYCEVKVCS